MAEDGRPDPLNEAAKPPRRWGTQALVVVVVITIGIVSGAKLWQPVKKVEQKVAAPIRDAVKRNAPLDSLPDLVDEACPAVVSLHYPGAPDPAPQAILLTQEGYAATTVAIAAGAAVEAWLNDGQRLKASVAGSDPVSGVTLLQIAGKDLPTVTLGDADLPRLGSVGITLASPIGHGCAVEAGLVASDFVTDGATGDYYLRVHAGTDLPAPGTPFLSADGRVAGLARPADAKGDPSDHYLPIDLVTTAVSYLMRGSGVPNPFGLIAEDLSPDLADRLGADRGRGAVIVMVGHGGLAEKAGLEVGDVVLSAGQSPISAASEFNRMLGGTKPIDLTIVRGTDQSTRTLTRPAAPPAKK